MSSRRITLVLGMHRSGTSAIAGAIHALGAGLGGGLVPAADDNPRGYFEHAEAVEINEALLLDLESGWDVPEPFADGWLETPGADAARGAIRALLARDFAGEGWWVLKDPRFCRLLPVWLPSLVEAGFHVDAVLAWRSPAGVVASLVKRDRMAPTQALHLLLEYLLDMLRDSGSLPRVTIDYDACLLQPEATLRIVAGALGWPVSSDAAYATAAAMFDDGQRHHRPGPVDGADAVPPSVFEDATVLAADPGRPDARLRLEAVRDAWRAAASRAAVHGSRWALLRERRRVRAALESARGLRIAFESAEQAAFERLAALQAQEQLLARTQAGLAEAERLSLQHLSAFETSAAHAKNLEAEIGVLRDEAVRARQAIETLQAQAAEWRERWSALDEAHRAVLSSRSWRWTGPLRWITARLRGDRR
jgi:hypothetical protein